MPRSSWPGATARPHASGCQSTPAGVQARVGTARTMIAESGSLVRFASRPGISSPPEFWVIIQESAGGISAGCRDPLAERLPAAAGRWHLARCWPIKSSDAVWASSPTPERPSSHQPDIAAPWPVLRVLALARRRKPVGVVHVPAVRPCRRKNWHTDRPKTRDQAVARAASTAGHVESPVICHVGDSLESDFRFSLYRRRRRNPNKIGRARLTRAGIASRSTGGELLTG